MFDKRIRDDIEKMTFNRVNLWNKLYSDEKCSKEFAQILANKFNSSIEQDFDTMSYAFVSEKKLDMTLITSAVEECIVEIMDKMHNEGYITEKEYSEFEKAKDNLFAIVLQIDNKIHIKL